MDKFLTGANEIETFTKIHQDIRNILSSAGFQLRKWRSNTQKMLEKLDVDGLENGVLDINKNNNVKD